MEAGKLVVRRGMDDGMPLTPVYRDTFTAPQLGLVWFRRDGSGRVTGLSVGITRARDVPFRRVR